MKAFYSILLLVLLVGCDVETDEMLVDDKDAIEVFQRAFWKRPTPHDKILHAERREWSDSDGTEQWQWFIVVEPSPELLKHLREDNAFGLSVAGTAPIPSAAPSWFTFEQDDVDILQAPRGNMRLFFSKAKDLLYATDTGGVFRPGVSEPALSQQPDPSSQ
ncbi:MAG: hypothetical protein ACI8T1_003349 [Verrucomicrobiales bacterium]|jgi:hypothetical protein